MKPPALNGSHSASEFCIKRGSRELAAYNLSGAQCQIDEDQKQKNSQLYEIQTERFRFSTWAMRALIPILAVPLVEQSGRKRLRDPADNRALPPQAAGAPCLS